MDIDMLAAQPKLAGCPLRLSVSPSSFASLFGCYQSDDKARLERAAGTGSLKMWAGFNERESAARLKLLAVCASVCVCDGWTGQKREETFHR